MNARGRFLFLTLIMVGACAIVMVVVTVTLYRYDIQKQREMLLVTAQSQARLIEAMARHDSVYEKNTPGGSTAATLSQILDAHERYVGFGETGEFTLARREGYFIVFALRHRHGTIKRPEPVAFGSDLAEPMRRALTGRSGTVIGLDYRGETVLAAHEPVAVLNLGIVAKIDLAEIRAPFIRSGLAASAIAFLIVLASMGLFFRIGNPIIERLEAYSQDLEKEVGEHKQAEDEIRKLNEELEQRVVERTTRLKAANKELESFAYSVSHDLRAPLRAIDGFTGILMEDYVAKLDEEGKRLGRVIQQDTRKMGQLIDDLLTFSRMGRTAMHFSEIDMKNMVNAIYHEATGAEERQRVKFSVTDLPKATGDPNMLRQVWLNLIANALKFSAQRKQAVISVASQEEEDKFIYCVEDNGAGFNMKYKDKLFGVFQRLHSERDFKGTGVGLALVQRIIHRHGGQVWAEGEVDKGAAFYFSLPKVARGSQG